MAMTKIEKAKMDRLEKMVRESRALCFQRFFPAKMVPRLGELQVGWSFNTYNRHVYQGCFTSTGHSNRSTTRTDTQESSGPWFTIKSDALKALRMEVQQEFAEILAHIDRNIDDTLLLESTENDREIYSA
jgi:hypothetical protein